jgi:hypothetical protein
MYDLLPPCHDLPVGAVRRPSPSLARARCGMRRRWSAGGAGGRSCGVRPVPRCRGVRRSGSRSRSRSFHCWLSDLHFCVCANATSSENPAPRAAPHSHTTLNRIARPDARQSQSTARAPLRAAAALDKTRALSASPPCRSHTDRQAPAPYPRGCRTHPRRRCQPAARCSSAGRRRVRRPCGRPAPTPSGRAHSAARACPAPARWPRVLDSPPRSRRPTVATRHAGRVVGTGTAWRRTWLRQRKIEHGV